MEWSESFPINSHGYEIHKATSRNRTIYTGWTPQTKEGKIVLSFSTDLDKVKAKCKRHFDNT